MSSSPPVPHDSLSRLRKALLLGAGVGLFLLFLWGSGFSGSTLLLVRDPAYLALGQAVALGYAALLVLRTRILLGSLGIRGGFGALLRVEFGNRFLSTFLPLRLNVPAKAWLLYNAGICDLEKGMAVSTLDYLVGLGTNLGLAALAVFIVFPRVRFVGLLETLVITGVLLGAYLLLPRRILERARVQSTRVPSRVRLLWNRLVHLAIELRSLWSSMLSHRLQLLLLPIQVLDALLNAAAAQAVALSAGVSLPWIPLTVAVAASAFVGGATPIPSGLGVRDVALVLLLRHLGMSLEISLYTAVMVRLLTLLPLALGGLFTLRSGLGWIRSALAPPAVGDPKGR